MSQVYYKLGKIFQAEKNVLKSAEYFKKAVEALPGAPWSNGAAKALASLQKTK